MRRSKAAHCQDFTKHRPLDDHGWAERWWLQATQIVAVVIFTVVQILGNATSMHHTGLRSTEAMSEAISSKMLWSALGIYDG